MPVCTKSMQTIIGALNFIVTFVAIFFVDKVGRKPLYNIGMSIIIFSNLLSGFALIFAPDAVQGYITTSALFLFTIGFAPGIGSYISLHIHTLQMFTNRLSRHRVLDPGI